MFRWERKQSHTHTHAHAHTQTHMHARSRIRIHIRTRIRTRTRTRTGTHASTHNDGYFMVSFEHINRKPHFIAKKRTIKPALKRKWKRLYETCSHNAEILYQPYLDLLVLVMLFPHRLKTASLDVLLCPGFNLLNDLYWMESIRIAFKR